MAQDHFQDVDPLRTQEANIALREVMQKPPSDMLVTSALASYTKPEDVPASDAVVAPGNYATATRLQG